MAVNEQLPVRRVRVRIPLELDQAIVTIRAREGLDFDDACTRVAALSDQNGKLLRRRLRRGHKR